MHPIDKQLIHMLHGEFEEGWKISQELQSLGPDNIPDTEGKPNPEMWLRHCFNRGWFCLNQGRFQEGMQLLDSGRFLNVYGSPPLNTDAPMWKGEDLTNKTIIISLEGGYGDEIIHARFATNLADKGAKVILAADPQLHSLFYRIEGVYKCITRVDAKSVEHDFWIPGFSASWVAGIDYSTLSGKPYLTPNPMSVDMWKNIITSDKIKVGVRWSGNPKFEHQQFRRFPPEFLINLSKHKELQLYSLQRDNDLRNLPENVIDLQHLLISWEDTTAAIINLDIVITSCTSIAHLSAGLGKETWVLVPILPYHTWTLDAPMSNTSPWYDSVKIYRQQKYADWTGTFNALYEDVEQKYNLKKPLDKLVKKEKTTLNLGCGYKKFEGAINVDSQSVVEPDIIHDLEKLPWPFEDNQFDHIIAKDILEHLGQNPKDFINIIKEMYRISKDGAEWEIQFPHWRADIAINDPTHVRLLTIETFRMFDQKYNQECKERGEADSPLGIFNGIDIEVADQHLIYNPYFEKLKEEGKISENELTIMLNTQNNICFSVIVLIKVHKPCRIL